MRGAAIIVLALAVMTPSVMAQSAQPDFSIETLEPQTLEVGECGLFLWSRDAEPKLMMVAYDKPGMVRLRANDRIMTLPRVAFSGENASGHFEKQRYADDGLTINVEVKFDEARTLRDGAYIKEGVMRITSKRGWDTLIPVGGLAACQRNQPTPAPRAR
jgi:hypothetical protein